MGQDISDWAMPCDFRPLCIVSDLETFWKAYHLSERKNYYEVIISEAPVKLFLDLEFYHKLNVEKNGTEMTRELILVLDDALVSEYSKKESSKGVIILDSSCHEKFSNHVIFTSVIFPNIRECGYFIKKTISSFNEEQRGLFQVNINGGVSSFIDQSIYTSNRNFRIYQSSKYDENRPLTCINFKDDTEFSTKVNDEEIFLETIISNTSKDQILFSNFTKVARDLEPLKLREKFKEINASPVPKIDGFVKQLVDPGRVRKITFNERKATVRYDVVGQHFCRTKKEEHKRNNIYFKYFINTKKLIQDCYSPSCQGKLIHEIEIPKCLKF